VDVVRVTPASTNALKNKMLLKIKVKNIKLVVDFLIQLWYNAFVCMKHKQICGRGCPKTQFNMRVWRKKISPKAKFWQL
jgi:hypothetical protein